MKLVIAMSENPNLDNEVADMTDAILSGKQVKASAEAGSYVNTIRGLNQLMGANVSIDVNFRNSLTQALNEEWDAVNRADRAKVIRFPERRVARILAFAAMLAVALFLVYAFAPGANGTSLNAAALGPLPVIAGLIMAVVAGVAIFFTLRNGR